MSAEMASRCILPICFAFRLSGAPIMIFPESLLSESSAPTFNAVSKMLQLVRVGRSNVRVNTPTVRRKK